MEQSKQDTVPMEVPNGIIRTKKKSQVLQYQWKQWLTSVIEAEEEWDVATTDIPNAFMQTNLNLKDEEGNRTIMKIRGQLVDILCELDDEYRDFVEMEAIYELLVSSMLFYKRLVTDLTKIGFKVNPYDPCVATNKIVDGKQTTVSWYVNDLKASHKHSTIIDDFITWVDDTCRLWKDR